MDHGFDPARPSLLVGLGLATDCRVVAVPAAVVAGLLVGRARGSSTLGRAFVLSAVAPLALVRGMRCIIAGLLHVCHQAIPGLAAVGGDLMGADGG